MRRISAASTGMIGILLVYMMMGMASQAAVLINGAGATFPFPLYSRWFSEFQKVEPEIQINYQSIGSGGGIRQFTEKTIDFGATDIPMNPAQLAKASAPVLHIPTVLGAVVVIYNLPGIPKGLKLSPDVLADLYLGVIKKWNDPRLTSLNPKMKLPDESVIVARRSDGSGTSAIFTDYLSKVSEPWKKKVGSGAAVNWPVGLGGKGNEGVSGLVKQTPGAIGYVEFIYAENNSLPYAAIQNKAGQFILPDVKSVSAAAEGIAKNIPDDFRISLTHPDQKNAYPLSAFTYLLVHQTMPKEKGKGIVQFLRWTLTEGQKHATTLHYSPLPDSMKKKVEASLNSIKLQ